MPINIRVVYSLSKLAHASKHLQCNELFAINKAIVHFVLREFVHVVNVVFKN